jgi:hypothetical protein
MAEIRTLFRPVGLKEMELILDSGSILFPPRFSWQPFFYPVLNYEYAEQIARDWNTKDPNSNYAGFVMEFQICGDYLNQFEVHQVGASVHRELWIPAQQLDEFNRHISGTIKVVASFYGENYVAQPEGHS